MIASRLNVDNDRDGLSKALADLQSQMSGTLKILIEGELKDLTQVSIVRELLGGRRTSSELVEAVYGVRRGELGFDSCYTRIRRAVADLESKGFVSRRLFGRDKPYYLTQLAVVRLTRIAKAAPRGRYALLPRIDIVIYTAAVALASICAVASAEVFSLPEGPWFLIIYSVALLLSGVALTRFLETLKVVI
jgi:hypothetical protein